MSTRIQVGDVLEIPTRQGLAYAQVTHVRKPDGPLIAVLPGFFSARPKDWTWVAAAAPRFRVFFPAAHAVSRKIISRVANCPMSPEVAKFPVLRCAGFVDRSGVEHDWWLWDGEREWRVTTLSPEQRRLSPREVWNDSLLIERIENGWSPEQGVRTGA